MNRRLRAGLEVVALYGLLGWIYVAVYAAAFPDDLSRPVTAVVPMRRDSFGILAFALSAAATTVLRARNGRLRAQGRHGAGRGWSRAVLHTAFGYGLAAWAYLCVNSLTHPRTIGMRLTHLSPWPSEGTTAVTGFVVSATALFLLRAAAPVEQPELKRGV